MIKSNMFPDNSNNLPKQIKNFQNGDEIKIIRDETPDAHAMYGIQMPEEGSIFDEDPDVGAVYAVRMPIDGEINDDDEPNIHAVYAVQITHGPIIKSTDLPGNLPGGYQIEKEPDEGKEVPSFLDKLLELLKKLLEARNKNVEEE